MLGACLLVRRAMLDDIGGLDEGMPMYGEDIELAYRAMRAGWERWYVPDAVAVHHYQRETDRSLVDARGARARPGHRSVRAPASRVARAAAVIQSLRSARWTLVHVSGPVVRTMCG